MFELGQLRHRFVMNDGELANEGLNVAPGIERDPVCKGLYHASVLALVAAQAINSEFKIRSVVEVKVSHHLGELELGVVDQSMHGGDGQPVQREPHNVEILQNLHKLDKREWGVKKQGRDAL